MMHLSLLSTAEVNLGLAERDNRFLPVVTY
jgi:hypothetical protein